MKLLLTSTGLSNKSITDALLKLVGREFAELTVAFIPTAADTYADKWFVDKDREQLINEGFRLQEVDVKGKNKQELLAELDGCDIIFVAGGNTFYLLQKLIENGADEIMKDFVKKGVVYVGSSAGSIIVGPSLEPVITLDDPDEAPELKSFNGLHLVDFVVLPHFEKEKYGEKHKAIMKKYGDKYKLVPINDEQAIVADGDSFNIIG